MRAASSRNELRRRFEKELKAREPLHLRKNGRREMAGARQDGDALPSGNGICSWHHPGW